MVWYISETTESAFYFKIFIFWFTHLHEFCTCSFDDLFSNRIIKNFFISFRIFRGNPQIFFCYTSLRKPNYHISQPKLSRFTTRKYVQCSATAKQTSRNYELVYIDKKTRINGLFRWRQVSSTFHSLPPLSFSFSFHPILLFFYVSITFCYLLLIRLRTRDRESSVSSRTSPWVYSEFSWNLI